MRTHRLKTIDCYWDAVDAGEKPFEVRRDDRGFQKGDILELVRWTKNINGVFSEERDNGNRPKILRRKIKYVLTGGQLGIEPGFVVLGLAKA